MSCLSTEARLAICREVCSDLASQIATAQDLLLNRAEDPNVAHVIAESMGRWGWMAERAAVLAGRPGALIKGDADAWLLPPLVLAALQKGGAA